MNSIVKINTGQVIKNTIIAGLVIFVVSFGSLFCAIKIMPDFFVDYINPIFNSDGSRDIYFYLHPFILSLSLAVFWNRFGELFSGNFILRGLEFGAVYAFVALIPVMWITYSAVDVSLTMVFSWLLYGFVQSCVAGFVFAKIDP